jgi:hypothetical protein
MRWTGHVARLAGIKNAYRILVGSLKGRGPPGPFKLFIFLGIKRPQCEAANFRPPGAVVVNVWTRRLPAFAVSCLVSE